MDDKSRPPDTEETPLTGEEAKNAAMRAALAIGQNSRGMAAELMRNAEMKVLRELAWGKRAFGLIESHEARYWLWVEEELRR